MASRLIKLLTLANECNIISFVGVSHEQEMLLPIIQWEGGYKVSEVRVGENESLESALKRFKRKCARAGVLAEIRKREHYEKPSVKRKKKAEAARKRKH